MAILRFLALTLRSGFIIWMLTILSISNWTHLGVSIVMGVPNSWIVYNGKSYKMDALGVHTLFQVPPKDTRKGHFVIIFDGGYPKPMVLNARMRFVQLWQYLGKWLQYRKLKVPMGGRGRRSWGFEEMLQSYPEIIEGTSCPLWFRGPHEWLDFTAIWSLNVAIEHGP